MPIELSDFERGAPFTGDAAAERGELGRRLSRAHLIQAAARQRAIIVLEGREGAAKTAALGAIAAALDPRFVSVTTIAPDRRRSAEGHWLARFWAALPEAGRAAIFFHSWYRRVLEDRVLGLVDDKEWRRAFDEINEFEAQQRDYGTLLVKLYFHATDATRHARLAEAEADPWRRLLLGPAELRTAAADAAYRAALDATLAQTNTRWSPWHLIDANDSEAAVLAALAKLADMMERAVPAEAPGDGPVIAFARDAQVSG